MLAKTKRRRVKILLVGDAVAADAVVVVAITITIIIMPHLVIAVEQQQNISRF